MHYLLLLYDDQQHASMPPDEHQGLAAESLANDDALRESGHLLATFELQTCETATTLRLEKDEVTVANGFQDLAPQRLNAIFTIDARDLNEAIRVASSMPQLRAGTIEVRTMLETNQLQVK